MVLEPVQVGGIAFLEPALRQAVLPRALVPGLDEVLRYVDAQHVGSEFRLRQDSRPIAAAEVQDLEPFGDPEPLGEPPSALPHALRNASEVALLPKCLVGIHRSSVLSSITAQSRRRALLGRRGGDVAVDGPCRGAY